MFIDLFGFMYKESQIFNVEPRYLTAKQLVVIALVFMLATLNLVFLECGLTFGESVSCFT